MTVDVLHVDSSLVVATEWSTASEDDLFVTTINEYVRRTLVAFWNTMILAAYCARLALRNYERRRIIPFLATFNKVS